MVKKSRKSRRSGRFSFRGMRRRHTPKQISLLPTLGLATSQFSNLGNGSMHAYGPIGGFMQNVQSNPQKAIGDLLRDEILTFTGYDASNGNWNISNARGTGVILGTLLASKVIGKFVGNPFKNLPYVGKKLKI